MVKDPKEAVEEIVERVGKHAARMILEGARIAPSTAEKLVAGRYKSEVGFLLLQKIYRAHERTFNRQSA